MFEFFRRAMKEGKHIQQWKLVDQKPNLKLKQDLGFICRWVHIIFYSFFLVYCNGWMPVSPHVGDCGEKKFIWIQERAERVSLCVNVLLWWETLVYTMFLCKPALTTFCLKEFISVSKKIWRGNCHNNHLCDGGDTELCSVWCAGFGVHSVFR